MRRSRYIRVPYAQPVYGQEEIDAVTGVLANPAALGPGAAAAKFEKQVSALLGKRHGVLVNSGSSANLLALEVLRLPPGSEVITPVLTFATTVAPLVQKQLVPVFVDVEEGTYLANIAQIEAAVSPATRAIMVPSLLGNIPNLERLRKVARKHKLPIIEDSCDTLGATFDGKAPGHYTDVSTTSFYATHIITAAAGGGMVCFNDRKLASRAKVIAAWGRQSTHRQSEDIGRRLRGSIAGQPYDAKFIFTEIGYNLQSSELNAAFGLVQLKRLKDFTRKRARRFKQLYELGRQYEKYLILPRQDERVETNWIAFPFTLRTGAPFSRVEITRFLEQRNIQTRPIFTGTITRQPGFARMNHRAAQPSFPVSDHIMRNGFLVGAHHGMSDQQMDHLIGSMKAFMRRHG
jgi:CDP-4-dehydro-6-deoxyglucose reductase, E1